MPGPAPYTKGSRSNGSRSHPCAQFVRFTEDENKKLAALCRRRGLTIQSFLHAAAMRALNEAQLGKKTDAEVVREEHAAATHENTTPKGLGIRERLQRDTVTHDYDDDDRLPAATPTVQTAPQPRAPGDHEILSLARTIVDSPPSARVDVWKAAVRALARGRTQEEALQLADDLDVAIKRLDNTPQTALERVRARMK